MILTVTGALPDDPTAPAYNARTDIKLDVLETAPWIWFPYPGKGVDDYSIKSSLFSVRPHVRAVYFKDGDRPTRLTRLS